MSAAQRSESAPTVPTEMPAKITLRAVSDSAASKKIEYQKWKATVEIILGIHDHDFLHDDQIKHINYEEGYNFLPEGYQQPSDIFADMKAACKSDVQSAVHETSLPTFHACRPDAGDTTYYVRKPRPLDSKGILKDESPSVLLNGDKKRADLYNKLGVRRKRVTSPSSRFPAEAFHQVGKVGEDFSPVERARDEGELQFELDLE